MSQFPDFLQQALNVAAAAREAKPEVQPSELLTSLRMIAVSPGYPTFRELLIEALLTVIEESPREASDQTAAHALFRARGIADVYRIMQSAEHGKDKGATP